MDLKKKKKAFTLHQSYQRCENNLRLQIGWKPFTFSFFFFFDSILTNDDNVVCLVLCRNWTDWFTLKLHTVFQILFGPQQPSPLYNQTTFFVSWTYLSLQMDETVIITMHSDFPGTAWNVLNWPSGVCLQGRCLPAVSAPATLVRQCSPHHFVFLSFFFLYFLL